MTEDPQRTAWIASMRRICDWLEAHPEVPRPHLMRGIPEHQELPSLAIYVREPLFGEPDQASARQRLAAIARAMGRANKTPGFSDNNLLVWRDFGGIAVYASAARADVCERVVIGAKTVTRMVPDPTVPLVKVTERVEQVEWVCGPLLDGAIAVGDPTEGLVEAGAA